MTEFTVQPDADGRTGFLSWKALSGTKRIKVALGRNGLTHNKCEGDGATPFGVFPLRYVCYRSDRVEKPNTELVVRAIEADDGWCDAPEDNAYNRPVKLPYSASHEKLWREDHLYDLFMVIGQNDSPVVPGKGSAIFVHVAKEGYAPTEGCVAMKLEDLQDLLANATPGDRIKVCQD